MKVRIFGSPSCQKCQLLCSALTLVKIPYDAVDAMSDDTQTLCDENDVDALPHVQLLDEDGKVVWQRAKTVTFADVVAQLKTNNATQRSTGTSG